MEKKKVCWVVFIIFKEVMSGRIIVKYVRLVVWEDIWKVECLGCVGSGDILFFGRVCLILVVCSCD